MTTRPQIEEMKEAVLQASGELLDQVRERLVRLLDSDLITHALLWRANGPKRFQRIAEKMAVVEREFGEPFWEVVRGFAEQRRSRQEVAEILEIDPRTFQRLLDTAAPAGIPWPDCTSRSRRWQESRRGPASEKQKASSRRSQKLAVAASVKARTRITPERLELGLALHEAGFMWRTINHVMETGVSFYALRRAVQVQVTEHGFEVRHALAEKGRLHPQYHELAGKAEAREAALGYCRRSPDHPWHKKPFKTA